MVSYSGDGVSFPKTASKLKTHSMICGVTDVKEQKLVRNYWITELGNDWQDISRLMVIFFFSDYFFDQYNFIEIKFVLYLQK